MNVDDVWVEVRSLERVEDGVRTYNIEVGGDHTYYAGGYLVHNKDDCPEF